MGNTSLEGNECTVQLLQSERDEILKLQFCQNCVVKTLQPTKNFFLLLFNFQSN
jgi:hypothetical protein